MVPFCGQTLCMQKNCLFLFSLALDEAKMPTRQTSCYHKEMIFDLLRPVKKDSSLKVPDNYKFWYTNNPPKKRPAVHRKQFSAKLNDFELFGK